MTPYLIIGNLGDKKFIDKHNGDRMDIDIPTYRIHHLLRSYTTAVKHDDVGSENDKIPFNTFDNIHKLSINIKKDQLIEQILSEAIAHFTTCAWEKKVQKIAGGILGALSGENGRRKAHGILMQDSRR
jgi:hypothetical protein